ncbi:hypothetical protein K439DRAFT_1274453, partial [Ramaria rubella]
EEASASDSESTSNDSSSEDVHISKALMARIQAYITTEPKAKMNDILIDSGTSCHMTPHQHWFIPRSYKQASGTGSVCFESKSLGSTKRITLTNVLHILVFLLTLISVHRFAKSNHMSIF